MTVDLDRSEIELLYRYLDGVIIEIEGNEAIGICKRGTGKAMRKIKQKLKAQLLKEV